MPDETKVPPNDGDGDETLGAKTPPDEKNETPASEPDDDTDDEE